LEEKIRLLENQIADIRTPDVDTKIKRHKDDYIHIPFSWAGFYRGLAAIGSIGLCMLCFWGVLFFVDRFNVGECFKPISEQIAISPDVLFFLYPFFAWFFSVWLVAVCIKAVFDAGWDDLGGLIGGLIVGLIVGLIFGLIVGLIGGLIDD